MGDFLVAQHAFAGMEGAQDIEAARQRGDELAILAAGPFGETVLERALEGGGSRDEMANVAHGRLLLVNGRLFLCGAEPAIGLTLSQCGLSGFCPANMQSGHVTDACFDYR